MALNADNPLAPCIHELQAAPHVWVAFSGGMDSTLLLHLAADILDTHQLTALHVNHGIHADSDHWEAQCRREAQGLNIAFQSESISMEDSANLEANAREARYRVFKNHLGSEHIMLLAHHANDQAETLIFRLMRGAGLRGLSGMPRRRTMGAGYLLRPLLDLERDQLQAMAKQRQLSWIEDPSNADVRLSRNYIRHQVLPRLQDHWPGAVERINQTARALAQAQTLLKSYAQDLIQGIDLRSEAFGQSIDLARFNLLDTNRRQLVLRQMLADHSEYPDDRRLTELLRQLHSADSESHIADSYEHAQLSVFRQRLYLLEKLDQFDRQQSYDWDGLGNLNIAGVGCLKASPTGFSGGGYQVRFRQGGERCKPLKREHSQSLKRLMQEHAVPPWLRERTPLIYQGAQLVAVAGVFSCSETVPLPELVWGQKAGQGEIRV